LLSEAFLQEPPTITEPKTFDFVLIHHWWRAKTKPIRVGPSRQYWELYIEESESKPLLKFTLDKNPLGNGDISGIFGFEKDHSLMDRGKDSEYIEPGKPLNPTKATPAYIRRLDKGKVKVYSLEDVYGKMEFKGKDFKGLFIMTRSEPDLNLWRVRKTKEKP